MSLHDELAKTFSGFFGEMGLDDSLPQLTEEEQKKVDEQHKKEQQEADELATRLASFEEHCGD